MSRVASLRWRVASRVSSAGCAALPLGPSDEMTDRSAHTTRHMYDIQGWRRERDLFCEGPISSFAVHAHAPPLPVPCVPGDGAYGHEIPVVKLHLCGAQERTECSDLGAQSMSPTVQSK
jgi:hypothetical protein